MIIDDIDFLRNLISAPSPSGFEYTAQKVFRNYISEYADEIKTDIHGNVIAFKKGSGQLKIMIAAHIDEVGLMVKYIDNEGYIHFGAIGGVDYTLLPGLTVKIIHDEKCFTGIIGKKPIHILQQDEMDKAPKKEELWIDIGAKDKEDAEKMVSVGDIISFISNFELLPNDLLVSKSTDDKAGIFIIAETLKQLSTEKLVPNLYFVASVQEEIGLRGAKTSAFGIEPDICIAIDVTHATDYPFINKNIHGDIKLGGGAVIAKGANINPKIFDLLLDTAIVNKINYQIEAIPNNIGTDIREIQTVKTGVATGFIGIPNRYMHTPTEIISIHDLNCIIELLIQFISNIHDDINLIPFIE